MPFVIKHIVSAEVRLHVGHDGMGMVNWFKLDTCTLIGTSAGRWPRYGKVIIEWHRL